jgi:hypothetical protein
MIPTYLEQLVHEGKAQFKSFSGALAEEFIIKVPDKCYIIIYEYWFLPQRKNFGALIGATPADPLLPFDYKDSIQFVNFYNSQNLFSYWHEFNPESQSRQIGSFPTTNPAQPGSYIGYLAEHTQYRKTYIKSDRDLAIYFTRLVTDDMALTNTAVGNFGPLTNFFGYGGETILTNLSNYHAVTLPNTFYAPLSNELSDAIAPGTIKGYDNLMTTSPSLLAGGGEITNAATYAGAGTQALGKARGQHFQMNYVLVNMENPKNLQ